MKNVLQVVFLALVLTALAQLDRGLAARPHPFLGPGNLHGSLISGGTEESTIPDRCTVTVERRTLPGESVASVEADIAALLDRCREADPGLVVHARTTLAREPFETTDGADLLDALARAAEGVTGRAPSPAPMTYWADSAFIAAAGIPTVLYGPPGEGAHADVEWVSIEGTRECADVLVRLAIDFCASS